MLKQSKLQPRAAKERKLLLAIAATIQAALDHTGVDTKHDKKTKHDFRKAYKAAKEAK